MIVVRNYTQRDLLKIQNLHEKAGLPPQCMPDLSNPLFFMRKIVEDDGTVALASFLKLTAEAFVLVDHEWQTPQWRWMALQKLTASTLSEAAVKGVQDVTAWLPEQIDKSFSERLIALGFVKSPWPSYSVRLD